MTPDVVSAKYLKDYLLELIFENGESGIVDFSKYLKIGGIFQRFNDLEFFKNFKVNHELGVITWHDEIDVAPETLYSEATNNPLPEWTDH